MTQKGGFVINFNKLFKQIFTPWHIKIKRISTARQTVLQRDLLAKIHFRDVYGSVSTFLGHRHFLQLFWEEIKYKLISLRVGISQGPGFLRNFFNHF